MENLNFDITSLGPRTIPSPLPLSREEGDFIADYVSDNEFFLYDILAIGGKSIPWNRRGLVERAGPRELIYFDPSKVHAGIITCGGLCPGLNNVIRAIVMTLWYNYGVRRISGFKFGFRGLMPQYRLPALELTPDLVANIHNDGGTLLGSSRGGGDRLSEVADSLERMNIRILFVIGGDGSQRGAHEIARLMTERKQKVAVVGVPKTIDNDLAFIQRSFGFDTAVSEAVDAVTGAHVEAHDAINGVAVVKLMGRESGFIAASTALGTSDVNYVLVPEVPFDLEGEHGLLAHLKKRLAARNHAVIVVAEGAGQHLLPASTTTDASGNKKLGDIGLFLKDTIKAYFKNEGMDINLKYIDPSYLIRSTKANPNDAIYCARLGANAVHAAMAGKTDIIISLIHNRYMHVPIRLAVSRRNRIDPESSLWRDVIEATGQPALMKNPS
ncbi:MAG: ATP-dependent 6-phosphofructokinase [Chitinispirillaceae bacterium]|nr:ATP-dependent 6-phosphofructokinase [Chitinispirillaceae bacterium]